MLIKLNSHTVRFMIGTQSRLFYVQKYAMKNLYSTTSRFSEKLKVTDTHNYFHKCTSNVPEFLSPFCVQAQVRYNSSDAVSSHSVPEFPKQGGVSSQDSVTNQPVEASSVVDNATETSSSSEFLNQSSSSTNIYPVFETVDSSSVSDIIEPTSILEGLEPSFASQGLGGWSPVGILQQCFEYGHIDLDIPWWLTIVIGTIIVRTLLFPIIIKGHKNAILVNNNLPQMQVLQMKMTEARQRGNALESVMYAQEIHNYMKDHDINPLKSAILPLVQAPVFISFFFALRGMANLPIESLKTGGLFWFENLSICDPYYILPLITSTTLFCTIELGAEGSFPNSMRHMRYILRAMPLIILPFTINFPAAILCYWVTSNSYSLCQVLFLKWKPVREYFNMPERIKHDENVLPLNKKGFVEGVKDAYTNIKITREIDERSRVDEIRFRKAGTGPVQKTYPYDPTKQTMAQASDRKTR